MFSSILCFENGQTLFEGFSVLFGQSLMKKKTHIQFATTYFCSEKLPTFMHFFSYKTYTFFPSKLHKAEDLIVDRIATEVQTYF